MEPPFFSVPPSESRGHLLRRRGDIAQEPLDYSVPDASAPKPGELMSIVDPLPAPPLGEARCLIIGVEHAGQWRFGRQCVDGVFAGRDPGAFLGCG